MHEAVDEPRGFLVFASDHERFQHKLEIVKRPDLDTADPFEPTSMT